MFHLDGQPNYISFVKCAQDYTFFVQEITLKYICFLKVYQNMHFSSKSMPNYAVPVNMYQHMHFSRNCASELPLILELHQNPTKDDDFH